MLPFSDCIKPVGGGWVGWLLLRRVLVFHLIHGLEDRRWCLSWFLCFSNSFLSHFPIFGWVDVSMINEVFGISEDDLVSM